MSPSTETNGQNFLRRPGSTRDCQANNDDDDDDDDDVSEADSQNYVKEKLINFPSEQEI
jgi:hypothetical protein